jgi:hypothetical protein
MSLKPLLFAAALAAVTALPANAEPVELVCNGTQYWTGEDHGSMQINGIHILVGDQTVEVSGTRIFAAIYPIDRDDSDAARVVFTLGLWGGSINRYSGELALSKHTDDTQKTVEHLINAKCGKADPLF